MYKCTLMGKPHHSYIASLNDLNGRFEGDEYSNLKVKLSFFCNDSKIQGSICELLLKCEVNEGACLLGLWIFKILLLLLKALSR